MNGNDRHNDLNVTWTAIAGFVGGILIFVFIIAVQILFHWTEQAQYRQKVVAQVPEQLSQLRSEQEARINSYRLVDEKRGIAAIPVDEAMLAFARDPAEACRRSGRRRHAAGGGRTGGRQHAASAARPSRPAATQPGGIVMKRLDHPSA